MSRSSIVPIALATACISIAPAAAADGRSVAPPEAPAAASATSAWSCVASARVRDQIVGTAWGTGATSRDEAASDALQRCSSRAGARTCEVRRCWNKPDGS